MSSLHRSHWQTSQRSPAFCGVYMGPRCRADHTVLGGESRTRLYSRARPTDSSAQACRLCCPWPCCVPAHHQTTRLKRLTSHGTRAVAIQSRPRTHTPQPSSLAVSLAPHRPCPAAHAHAPYYPHRPSSSIPRCSAQMCVFNLQPIHPERDSHEGMASALLLASKPQGE